MNFISGLLLFITAFTFIVIKCISKKVYFFLIILYNGHYMNKFGDQINRTSNPVKFQQFQINTKTSSFTLSVQGLIGGPIKHCTQVFI